MRKFVEVESFIGSISIARKLDSIPADREYYPSLQKLLCPRPQIITAVEKQTAEWKYLEIIFFLPCVIEIV